MSNDHEINIENRLTRLEADVNHMLTNDLVHLREIAEITSQKTDKILWWVIGSLVTLVFTLLGLIIHGALTYFQIK